MSCQWFALCDNSADGVVKHPILGNVPTCKRCADKLDLVLLYDPINPNPDLLPEPEDADCWHESHDNIVLLVQWMAHDGQSAYNVADAVEKPWKFLDEYKMARYDLENAK
jgi:hypothetical protein